MSNGASPQDRVLTLFNNLNTLFSFRYYEILGILAGLISGEPVILVGDVGTAKTALVETLAKLCGAKYFYYLMSKFTEPDEILGVIDVKALREGRYVRRIEGKLPDAEIIFLDEVFKASSAIRNVLLDVILNKRFFNDGRYEPLNVIGMFFASNEVSEDEEDVAFYDRMTIRCFVNKVPPMGTFDLLRKGIRLEDSHVQQVLNLDDIKALRAMTLDRFKQLYNPHKVVVKMVELVGGLESMGIYVSDRRKIKILKVASAISVLFKEKDVTIKDVVDAIILCVPHNESQCSAIASFLDRRGVYGHIMKLSDLNAMLAELSYLTYVIEAGYPKGKDELKDVVRTIKKEVADVPNHPRFKPHLNAINRMLEELAMYLEGR